MPSCFNIAARLAAVTISLAGACFPTITVNEVAIFGKSASVLSVVQQSSIHRSQDSVAAHIPSPQQAGSSTRTQAPKAVQVYDAQAPASCVSHVPQSVAHEQEFSVPVHTPSPQENSCKGCASAGGAVSWAREEDSLGVGGADDNVVTSIGPFWSA